MTESDDWREWQESPILFPGTVGIASADEGGGRDVPALTTPLALGLAVTMPQFGEFNVTHVPSGRSMGTQTYERSCNALLVLARFASIGAAYGLDFEAAGEEAGAALAAVYDKPVPFPDAICSGSEGERPLTVLEWVRMLGDSGLIYAGEFPWESADENPGNRAVLLLRSLPKPAPVVQAEGEG